MVLPTLMTKPSPFIQVCNPSIVGAMVPDQKLGLTCIRGLTTITHLYIINDRAVGNHTSYGEVFPQVYMTGGSGV